MTRLVVVGGGIAGLAAAWEGLRSGAEVTVLEAGGRLGGKILTEQVEGRPVDLGPDSFLARVPDAVGLCRELGLGAELVSPAADAAAVWSRGRLRRLPAGLVLGVPSGLVPLARSGILSPVGLGRAALDLVLPRLGPDGDRSVGDLVRARLGRQVHERLVDPLLGGIHAGPSELLSAGATAPALARAGATHRSLLLGLRAARGEATGTGPVFLSLAGGLGRLVGRLAEALREGGATIALGTPAEALPLAGAHATVVAAPAPAAAELVAPASPDAAGELRAIEHAGVALAVLVYPASAFPGPGPGRARWAGLSGFLVPRHEGRLVTACSFGSSKWPWWAGPGRVVLRVSAGRWGDERALAMDDAELAGRMHAEVAEALDLGEGPGQVRVARWHRALPQYRVGHLDRVARIEAAVARDLPGVVLAGAAYRGVGVAACAAQGRAAARRALGHASR